MTRTFGVRVGVCWLAISWAGMLLAAPPSALWFPKAPQLPAPTGEIVRVATVDQLFKAAGTVRPGSTILLEDGTYSMPRYFELHTDRVTLRSASGSRDRVILDGTGSRHGELVGITNCSGVTIADLTIQNIKWNGFKINSDKRATNVTIRNCVIHNIWQRGVKGVAVPPALRATFRPTDCRIEYCLFYNDRPKEFSDDPADTPERFGGNYIGGIDTMYARAWKIHDNVFVGIHGKTRECRGAVFVWNNSEDCLIERNIIIDCDTGICLGNPSRAKDTLWHCRNCIVRNNFVVRCPEGGILASHTRDCRIVNNTIHDPTSKLHRLIWVQPDNDGLVVANNLLSGPPVLVAPASGSKLISNVVRKDLAELFADASRGDLHLKQASEDVVDAGQSRPEVSADIDGQPRSSPPDVGADEYEAGRGPAAAASPPVPSPPVPSPSAAADRPVVVDTDWVDAMRRVHMGFSGQNGYVAQFGDSITYSMAFWTPLGWDDPQKYLAGDDGLPKTPDDVRWRDWVKGTRDKGPDHANYSGWRVGQLLAAMDAVLKRDKPEVAIIMVGSNDISGNRVPDTYAGQLEAVVQKCVTAHCVPILNTIPPRRDHDEAVSEINQIIRDTAKRFHLPLVDYYAEILQRRPGDSWDGTLISEDGVHPTGGKNNVYSADNLEICGYALRNWTNFLMLRQVYFRVLQWKGKLLPGQGEVAVPANSGKAESGQMPAARSDGGPKAAKRQPGPDLPVVPKPAPADSGRATGSVGAPERIAASRQAAVVYSPRVISPYVADTYSMRTFAQFPRWRDLKDDARAWEIYKYLADKQTGLFHMNVVREGPDQLGEFSEVRDPVKIINVYGYAYCGILGPVMAGVSEEAGIGPSRTLSLPDWKHSTSEAFYQNRWHYLDLDVRAVFRRADGTLASMDDARWDASLWHDRGPLFFPNDPLETTRAIYQKTHVDYFYRFNQTGHTMDYVLRPGEQFIRWWQPQGGRWHHLPAYNASKWMVQLLSAEPRGPKPNHRDFTVHNYGNGRFTYEPDLTDRSNDVELGAYELENMVVSEDGLTLKDPGTGHVVFEVRTPYVIVPWVGKLDSTADDREASVVEMSATGAKVSVSVDNGLTWGPVSERRITGTHPRQYDLTEETSGRYGYLLKVSLNGQPQEAVVRSLKMTTWVQVAPATLPALHKGHNQMTLLAGDDYGLPTRTVEVRSRASQPQELLKYLTAPPRDYDPSRRTAKIRGSVVVKVPAPPGTWIAWFKATGQFATYQGEAAKKTANAIAYAVDRPSVFTTIYEAHVPTYTNHWNYNAAAEVPLDTMTKMLYLRYTGDPALNNFAVYAHCVPEKPPTVSPVVITHVWHALGEEKQMSVTMSGAGPYDIDVDGDPVNVSVEVQVPRSAR